MNKIFAIIIEFYSLGQKLLLCKNMCLSVISANIVSIEEGGANLPEIN